MAVQCEHDGPQPVVEGRLDGRTVGARDGAIHVAVKSPFGGGIDVLHGTPGCASRRKENLIRHLFVQQVHEGPLMGSKREVPPCLIAESPGITAQGNGHISGPAVTGIDFPNFARSSHRRFHLMEGLTDVGLSGIQASQHRVFSILPFKVQDPSGAGVSSARKTFSAFWKCSRSTVGPFSSSRIRSKEAPLAMIAGS